MARINVPLRGVVVHTMLLAFTKCRGNSQNYKHIPKSWTVNINRIPASIAVSHPLWYEKQRAITLRGEGWLRQTLARMLFCFIAHVWEAGTTITPSVRARWASTGYTRNNFSRGRASLRGRGRVRKNTEDARTVRGARDFQFIVAFHRRIWDDSISPPMLHKVGGNLRVIAPAIQASSWFFWISIVSTWNMQFPTSIGIEERCSWGSSLPLYGLYGRQPCERSESPVDYHPIRLGHRAHHPILSTYPSVGWISPPSGGFQPVVHKPPGRSFHQWPVSNAHIMLYL